MKRTRRGGGPLLPAVLLTVVAAVASGCCKEEAAAQAPHREGHVQPREQKVYTNQDLASLPPATVLPVVSDSSRAARRPSARVEQDAAAELRTTVAERRVAKALARVDELEKRLLAIHNPFLPRPKLPPEEARAWDGLDGVERADRVERQLAQARGELAAAEAELAKEETHILTSARTRS